jgi:hypothetical protein
MRLVEIRRSDGGSVCRAEVADRFFTRARGLLGRKSLAEDAGLLIKPCTSVHTFFMRFTIDVVYLDADHRVIKALTMKPFRMSMGGKGTKQTLEMAPGGIVRTGVAPGVQLQVSEAAPVEG